MVHELPSVFRVPLLASQAAGLVSIDGSRKKTDVIAAKRNTAKRREK